MTSTKTAMVFAIIVAFCSSLATAQNALDNPYNNRAILLHYSGASLKALEQDDPTKIDLISYYFNQSYDVQIVDCPSCPVDLDVLLNLDLFNVVNYEELRLVQEDVNFLYKNTYEITLHSGQTVNSNLGAYSINNILKLEPSSALPQWVGTGDSQFDYEMYKKALSRWIIANPDTYRQLTNGNDLIKISASEFLTLPVDKVNELSSNPEGYIIIE